MMQAARRPWPWMRRAGTRRCRRGSISWAGRSIGADVRAVFGSSRFTPAGFHLSVAPLALGSWCQLHIYAHSTLNGTWDDRPVNAQVVADEVTGDPRRFTEKERDAETGLDSS